MDTCETTSAFIILFVVIIVLDSLYNAELLPDKTVDVHHKRDRRRCRIFFLKFARVDIEKYLAKKAKRETAGNHPNIIHPNELSLM